MAQVDTNIVLGGANPQIDVSQGLRALAFGQDLAQTRQRNRLTDLALAEKQGLNNAYAGALNPDGTVDQTRLTQGLVAAGQGSAIPGAQRALTDSNTSQLNLRTAEREKLNRDVQLVASGLNGVTDEATYQAAKTRLSGLGVPIDGAPERFDPTWVRNTQAQALTAAQFMGQQQQNQQQAQTQANSDRDFELRRDALTYNQQNPQRQVVDTPEGPVAVDGRTGIGERVTVNGQAVGPKKEPASAQGERDARDVLSLLDQAEPLIAKSTGSYGGALIDQGAQVFGFALPGSQAASQLKALQGSLISKMPKMSGPQSDKDVQLYREMAGQIGDPTIPAPNKIAAIKTIREINNRYLENQGVKPAASRESPAEKTIRRRGKLPDGRSVVEYTDGTQEVLR